MKDIKTQVKEISINVTFMDGETFHTKNPKTMILSYQNFDLEEIEKKSIEAGKYMLPKGSDIGGIQIFGKHENIKFALFSLLKQMVGHLNLEEVIGIFSEVTKIKAQQDAMDEKLRTKGKKDKSNGKLPN